MSASKVQTELLSALESYVDKLAAYHRGGVPRRSIDSDGAAFLKALDRYIDKSLADRIAKARHA